jgi:hypothetical protein
VEIAIDNDDKNLYDVQNQTSSHLHWPSPPQRPMNLMSGRLATQTNEHITINLYSPDVVIKHIWDAIEQSRNILGLQDNWDGEDTSAYRASTWERATEFLQKNLLSMYLTFSNRVDVPRILPGPNGSIDLHWKTSHHELLINIPEDPNEPANFYGDNQLDQSVKGTIDTSKNHEWLLMWLMQ